MKAPKKGRFFFKEVEPIVQNERLKTKYEELLVIKSVIMQTEVRDDLEKSHAINSALEKIREASLLSE